MILELIASRLYVSFFRASGGLLPAAEAGPAVAQGRTGVSLGGSRVGSGNARYDLLCFWPVDLCMSSVGARGTICLPEDDMET